MSARQIQHFLQPCVIEPCPDCGAKPDTDSETFRTFVRHDECCPLWNGVLAVIADDALWFRRNSWAELRTRPLYAAEMAELNWTLGLGWPEPEVQMLVIRTGLRCLAVVEESWQT